MTEMEMKILEILNDIQPSFDFTGNEDFVAAGYLDSFDVVTLVAGLENAFSIAVPALEIVPENFSSLGAIAALAQKSPKKAV